MKSKQLIVLSIALGMAQTSFAQYNEVLSKVRPFTSYKVEVFYQGEPHPFITLQLNSWFNHQNWFRHPVGGFRRTFYRVTGAGRVDQTRAVTNRLGIGKLRLRAGEPFLAAKLSGDIAWSW